MSAFISLCMLLSAAPVVMAEEDTAATPVVISEQTGEALLSDDFSAGNKNWTEISGKAYKFNKLNGTLEFAENEQEVILLGGAGSWENYEQKIKFTPTKIGYLGFFARYKNEDNNIVVKIYGSDSAIKVLQKSKGGNYELLKSFKYRFEKNTAYELGIKVVGKKLYVYVNGEELGNTTRVGIDKGQIGFTSVKSAVAIDDIRVTTATPSKDDIVPEKEAAVIYVAPDGNDTTADGTSAKPYATLEGARELVSMKKIGNTPVNIIFKEGTYEIENTIKFSSADSGTESAPITYMAEPGKKVTFTMAKKIDTTKFEPVKGDALKRINKNAKGKVLVYDLKQLGIKADGYMMETGGQMTYSYYPPYILLNDKEQTLSRWPNNGWNYFDEVLDIGGTAQSVWQGAKKLAEVQNHGATFRFTGLNPSTWETIDGAYIMGYMGSTYRAEWAKLASLDKENSTISLDHYTAYGVTKGHRWAIVNILEEVDIPGEWCIDSQTHKLYYWPTKELTADDKVEITTSMNDLVQMNGVENVVIDGITFEKTRANGIVMQGCNNVTIKNSTVRDVVRDGIKITTCNNINITGNIVRDTGDSGVRVLRCGNLATLEGANIQVTNNIGYNMAKLSTLANGFWADAETYSTNNVGVFMTNNTLSRSDTGIGGGYQLDGAIAYNEIFDCVRNEADAGVIYCGRTFTNYDNNYEYNYIHDYGSLMSSETYSVNAYFMDDLDSGHHITNNIIVPNNVRNTGGVKLGGGRDNVVMYNTIVGAQRGFIFEDRTSNKSDDYIQTYTAYTLAQRDHKKWNFFESPWIDKHPGVAQIIKDYEAGERYVPKNNVATNNVLVNDLAEQVAAHMAENGKIENNYEINDDIFVDSAKQDYRITFAAKEKYNLPDGLIYEDFDLDKIGASLMPEFEKSFNMTYPANGATGIETRDMWIAWEIQDFANGYEYVVATDPEFKYIVCENETDKNFAEVTGLKNNQKYYWKVAARNQSRRQQDKWDADTGVWSFTTAEEDAVIRDPLKVAMAKAKEKVKEINEGTEIGAYAQGTRKLIQNEISKANKVYNKKDVKQSEIVNATSELNNVTSTIAKYTNLGYQKVKIGKAEDWQVGVDGTDISVTDGAEGGVEIKRNNKNAGVAYVDEVYSGSAVLCFDMKIDDYDGGWFGLSIKQRYKDSLPYNKSSQSNYLIVIKEDVIEFQRYNQDMEIGGIMTTIPNDVFKKGQWQNVQFGALPTERGTYLIFNVDGKEVFRYRDTEAPFFDDGHFTVFPTTGKISLREPESIPTDEIVLPNPDAIDKVYTTMSSSNVFATGLWTKIAKKGYQEATVYSSNQPANSIKWLIQEGQGTAMFKVYFWNDKSVNTDKAATVKFANYGANEQKTIDMTAQPDGWVELGEYLFISESVHMEGGFEFIPSGDGDLAVSALRVVRILDEK